MNAQHLSSHCVSPESYNFSSSADNVLFTGSADLYFVHGASSKAKIDFGVGERNEVKSP